MSSQIFPSDYNFNNNQLIKNNNSGIFNYFLESINKYRLNIFGSLLIILLIGIILSFIILLSKLKCSDLNDDDINLLTVVYILQLPLILLLPLIYQIEFNNKTIILYILLLGPFITSIIYYAHYRNQRPINREFIMNSGIFNIVSLTLAFIINISDIYKMYILKNYCNK